MLGVNMIEPLTDADVEALPAWGQWSKRGVNINLSFKPQGWVHQIKSGYRESQNILPIEDEYAMLLDRKIAEYPPVIKGIIENKYKNRKSLRWLAKKYKKSRESIKQILGNLVDNT